MKIEREKIKKIEDHLSGLKNFAISKGNFVFPIEFAEKEVDGISITVSNRASGSEKKPEPGLLFKGNGSYIVLCDFQFARKVDFVDLCDLLGCSLSTKGRELLGTIDCYLVDSSNILAEFN